MAKRSLEKDRYLYMYITTAVICVVIIAIISAVLLCGNLFAGEESGIVVSEISIAGADPSEESNLISEETSTPDVIDISGYKEIAVQPDGISEGSLIIVGNTEYATAPAAGQLDLVNIYDNRPKGLYTLSGTKLELQREALDSLNEMIKDFNEAAGTGYIMVNDAYSSIETLKSKNTLAPFADLASGLSVRLAVFPSSNGKMGEGIYLWLQDHCHKYGYILRYPSDKTEQTASPASAAVYRYVGAPHAGYMKANNLCLEEYINLLKEYNYMNPLSYIDRDNGEGYLIYFTAADYASSALLSVPENYEYAVSGNNSDGFIITVMLGAEK